MLLPSAEPYGVPQVLIAPVPSAPVANRSHPAQVDAIQLSGACHGAVMMRRLTALRVNAVALGAWSLDELFPSLTSLGPFKDTLGPRWVFMWG